LNGSLCVRQLASIREEIPPGEQHFGPLINAGKVKELRLWYGEAIGKGALPIFEGALDEALFFPEQDTSAYLAPTALINVPRDCALYHSEPLQAPCPTTKRCVTP